MYAYYTVSAMKISISAEQALLKDDRNFHGMVWERYHLVAFLTAKKFTQCRSVCFIVLISQRTQAFWQLASAIYTGLSLSTV